MPFKTLLTQVAAASALAFATLGAHAETYNFELTGGYNASWQLSSTPTPNEDYYQEGVSFGFTDVPGTFAGASDSKTLVFYSSQYDGGIGIYSLNIDFESVGPQLYTGSEASPTFKLGSFQLNGGNAMLTISSVSAVPEPATVGMMLAGLGLVGGIAARRRKAVDEDAATA